MTSSARRGLPAAILLTVLVMVAASAPSPFYPGIAQRLHLAPVAITLVFAVYAFTLLATLLFAGSLSDRIGRRPVITLGSAALAISLSMFGVADSIGELLAGRALQGVAAGLLIPALSAMMVDTETAYRPDTAAAWNTAAPMSGLAIGALGASLALDVTNRPVGLVFGLLVGAFVLAAAAIWAIPESAPHTPRLRPGPMFSVPPRARGMLVMSTPAIVAGWATNGLFLALGTSLMNNEFDAQTHVEQALVIVILAVSGVATAMAVRRRSPRLITIYGAAALAVGTTASLVALGAQSYPGYLAAAAIVGSGFGTAFMGALRSIIPLAEAHERAALMSVIYTVSYVAFGVPAIMAGLLVPALGYGGTMTALGSVIALLATMTATVRAVSKEPPPPRR